MLDDEPQNPTTTESTPAPRRRRAAGRPAGPPVEAAALDAPEAAAPEVKASAKAPAKAQDKAVAKDQAEAGAEPDGPARSRTRKRPAKKAAAPPVEEAVAEDPAAEAPAADAPAADAPAAEAAPARTRTRKRPAKKAEPEPEAEAAEETEETEEEADEAAPARLAAPAVLFQAPDPEPAPSTRRRRVAGRPAGEPGAEEAATPAVETEADEPTSATQSSANRRRRGRGRGPGAEHPVDEIDEKIEALNEAGDAGTFEDGADADDDEDGEGGEAAAARRRRRRRSGRGRRGRSGRPEGEGGDDDEPGEAEAGPENAEASDADGEDSDAAGSRRRRRRRRRGDDADASSPDDPAQTVTRVRTTRERGGGDSNEVTAVRGSTRLEAKKQRRREGREAGRRRVPILSEAEFLARREAVDRVMIVRENAERTQIAVLEDGVLVEHYVNKRESSSLMGDVFLGRVQNVLPSMEAAFIDIGKGRNAVLYAGEVNFDGLEGQPKRIEHALKSGQSVLVQVTKDPMGHKGARLTSQVSLPGRYLVYVPDSSMTGISRKLPDTERTRLKNILRQVVPENAGVIVRTAAEGASEDELRRDVERLAAQWEKIAAKAKTASAPALLLGEPDLTTRVVRDVFNEDFTSLVVAGETAYAEISEYLEAVAPDLAPRLSRWSENKDVFAAHRVDEQILKALDRKVWLPSGGSLVIDRTEAMTVVDVNTGKFTGSGGNLEETVTKNNLEAAEEIVRQLRLRDIGGIIVVDFIDMVLENNRELVLRRLVECLGRDRTKHQVAEVTSLGLVQMTRKRIGQGLLEAFSTTCEHCHGRGHHVRTDDSERQSRPKPTPVPPANGAAKAAPGEAEAEPNGEDAPAKSRSGRRRRGRGGGGDPAAVAVEEDAPVEQEPVVAPSEDEPAEEVSEDVADVAGVPV
ncbi:MAG: Rne/Rng family ribonuclease [Sporichthyaceae bacterium]